ncbi:S-adenosylmethionine:tRNA ribosyltransferase-isomerase [Lederbergia citrea]|uniref:S-adenosylmethionine:tRNA ribosyltransferase-isomerase n=1 Tax=Lederbergia citrea TaxID=2833581 RepID=UPI001BCA52E9|nr:S-adenosylmethionine:tRNA ribosyltransferase-isomerase [Lederbergia citrea]MBS4177937.1 S-adenosylmethionine:tRNA ribosyltransferase-isomerase [Lederbergia citrea]
MTAVHNFQIPKHLNALSPAEYRGKSREDVRLLVLDRLNGTTFHAHFNQLQDYLMPGDLLVINNSRTIPAVLTGKYKNNTIEVRLSRQVSEQEWDAVILGNTLAIGSTLTFPGDMSAVVISDGSELPLVTLSFSKSGLDLLNHIYRIGLPIHYEYIDYPWPLDTYQTAFASVPGSVEMPSAGRALSWKMLNNLKEQGIDFGFLQLHTGLSYYGENMWPHPEKHPESYCIPLKTAQQIAKTKVNGGRVIAVGTTVVRALETAANEDGTVKPQSGLTSLYIKKDYQLTVVDGLLTGFHEPEASHLDLLTAFIEENHLIKAYSKALDQGYLWHEFGDMNLVLNMNGFY